MIRLLLWNGLLLAVVAVATPRLWRLDQRRATVLAALWVGLLLIDVFLLRSPVLAAHWLPWDDLLYHLNLVLPLVAALLATVLPHLRVRSKPARAVVIALGLLGAVATHRFWFAPRALGSEQVAPVGTVVLQTDTENCVPATLVNLARAHGETDWTEREVAVLAETRRGMGTPLLGALRAARVLFEPTGRDVRLVAADWSDLLASELPVMAEVGLGARPATPAGEKLDAYDRSWVRGAMHVVLVERIDLGAGRVYVIDPDVGRERWSIEGFRTLWTGVLLGTSAPPAPL